MKYKEIKYPFFLALHYFVVLFRTNKKSVSLLRIPLLRRCKFLWKRFWIRGKQDKTIEAAIRRQLAFLFLRVSLYSTILKFLSYVSCLLLQNISFFSLAEFGIMFFCNFLHHKWFFKGYTGKRIKFNTIYIKLFSFILIYIWIPDCFKYIFLVIFSIFIFHVKSSRYICYILQPVVTRDQNTGGSHTMTEYIF